MNRVAGILSLLVLAGCGGQRYFAEGPGQGANVSGEYRTEERPGRNNCRTFSPEIEDRIVVVEHTPNSTQLIFIIGKESIVADLRSDGRFKTPTVARGQGYNLTALRIEGRFGKAVFKATVTVTAADDLPPEMPRRRGSSPAQPRSCEYVLQWDGNRLNDALVLP